MKEGGERERDRGLAGILRRGDFCAKREIS